ncbi:mitochondrial ribosomal protein L22 [Leptinotarsa decemlineata]|uniref:mitochondrial ribosomal protein L22 n=1 Tax=Leptinotarsa decemlineata TaxID=7539 RepID=UPI000C254993|nr:39S ribosomal protein L22, mitochondrial [Leptinotarsa decemlineata]
MNMALTKACWRLSDKLFLPTTKQFQKIHTTGIVSAWADEQEATKKWLKYNDKIYPPQSPNEEPRPAYVCHQRTNIKYSPWKMWYIASFIRGMPVDEAIRQLKFVLKKGAKDIREVLEEAKEIAVKEHNVEFPSNMWVAESFVGKGVVIKGMRRHARMRFGIIRYFHIHYFVRLEEGTPPEHYYLPYPKKPHEQLSDWLESMRKRKIINSL